MEKDILKNNVTEEDRKNIVEKYGKTNANSQKNYLRAVETEDESGSYIKSNRADGENKKELFMFNFN